MARKLKNAIVLYSHHVMRTLGQAAHAPIVIITYTCTKVNAVSKCDAASRKAFCVGKITDYRHTVLVVEGGFPPLLLYLTSLFL